MKIILVVVLVLTVLGAYLGISQAKHSNDLVRKEIENMRNMGCVKVGEIAENDMILIVKPKQYQYKCNI